MKWVKHGQNCKLCGGNRLLSIEGDALEVWRSGADEVERLQAPEGELAGIPDFASKLAGQVARIAGLLHVMDGSGDGSIETRNVRHAWDIGLYFLEHAKRVFQMLSAGSRVELAQKILRWIETGRYNQLTASDVYRVFRNSSGISSVSDLVPALECLQEREYLRLLENTGRGRKGHGRFEVNPALWGSE